MYIPSTKDYVHQLKEFSMKDKESKDFLLLYISETNEKPLSQLGMHSWFFYGWWIIVKRVKDREMIIDLGTLQISMYNTPFVPLDSPLEVAAYSLWCAHHKSRNETESESLQLDCILNS